MFYVKLLFLILVTHASVKAATVIARYDAAVDPLSVNWRGSDSSTTHVQFAAGQSAGVDVWKIQDPGLAVNETKKSNSQYYYQSYSTAKISTFLQSGWDLDFSMKVPSLTEFAGTAWARDSNAMVGIYWLNPVTLDQRVSFALQTGRDSNGNTLVSVNGISGTFLLTPDFHDYRFSYRDGVVDFYIDGAYKGSTIGSSTSSVSQTHLLYWGDNNNTPTANPNGERVTYFKSVMFSQVPEPSRVMLGLLAVCVLFLQRRRKV